MVKHLGRAALLLAATTAWAGAGVEPAGVDSAKRVADTRTLDGKTYVLLGRGETPEYELVLYIEESEARRHFPALAARAGGKTRARLTAGDHAQTFVIWGRFPKLAQLRCKTDVAAVRWREVLQAGLADELSDKASPELRRAAESFVALFADDLRTGDELTLFGDGDGKLWIERAGERREALPSPKLVRAVWSMWLGQKPISPELRRAVVERIDLLGK